MEIKLPEDHSQRLQALDPKQSFIVQAPAGSGKTELLTQRYLVLLADACQSPEEVVAITFTRKAASEMRARIFAALNAGLQPPPVEPHALHTWQLAKKVVEKEAHSGWNLLHNPNRLRVITIDALCARLAKSAPITSHFGTLPQVAEDAQALYSKAAQQLLTQLEVEQPWVESLKIILLHLDNNYQMIENLLISMLARRDQWLSIVMSHRHDQSRLVLEAALENLTLESLIKLDQLLDPIVKSELLSLLRFAAANLKNTHEESYITHWYELENFPQVDSSQIPLWLGLTELLLTKALEWRKAINKTLGFPSATEGVDKLEKSHFKMMKQRMVKLLSELTSNDQLYQALTTLTLLPPPRYSSAQWQLVDALITLLPILVAHLHLIFREQNVVDFIAIAEGAVQALGELDNPTDLALHLDYLIKHLLVDEFQDTSLTQFRLLELLTAGWQPQEGRTLFLVGDPMQSIYRFRQAEVGIFLKVKKAGLGQIKVVPLTLKANFRSTPTLINWFNQTFQQIFPQYENPELGAISFSPSMAFNQDTLDSQVITHSHQLNDDINKKIIALVQQETVHDNQSLAILVRSRSHLKALIPEFKKANIKFQAVEVDRLIYSPVVRDLLALTKALTHLGDRISWLAILRAPWCGLNLTDLHTIAQHAADIIIWDSLATVANLSAKGQQHLQRVIPILDAAIKNRSRNTISDWIAYSWYALGGPACLEEEFEIENSRAYFRILDQFQKGSYLDLLALENKLWHSFSHSGDPTANIQVMTIHKSKGLEFDTVLLPYLDKKAALDKSSLLVWLARQNSLGGNDLILAPIKSREEKHDLIYRYIKNQHSLKADFELIRLLYVAATRARKKLHLMGQAGNPGNGSFLQMLWSSIGDSFQVKDDVATEDASLINNFTYLSRLTLDWQSNFNFPQALPSLGHYTLSWHYFTRHHVGTVIHHGLQKISLNNTLFDHLAAEKKLWQKKLLQLGVVRNQLEACLDKVASAIDKTVNDERGRWLLSAQHLEAKSEFAIAVQVNDGITHHIVDRTFIDEQGVRWIIDYKTTDFEEDISCYRSQLENYAKAFKLLENRPIKLGVYFPLTTGWYEWSFEEHYG